MGLAVHSPRKAGDTYDIIYYPPAPRAMIEVVDPNDPTRVVDYGETGRVRLTTLTQRVLHAALPRARRGRARAALRAYPWDGVRNVRPFSRLRRRRWSRESTDVLPHPGPAPRPAVPQRGRRAGRRTSETREPLVEVSQANAGLVRRDLRQESQQAMRASLAAFSMRELMALSARAAELFATDTLPLGDEDADARRLRAPDSRPPPACRT